VLSSAEPETLTEAVGVLDAFDARVRRAMDDTDDA